MATTKLARITNADMWDALRAKFPQFNSTTAKATAALFTEKGFEQLQSLNPTQLNDFFDLSMKVYLQRINISTAKDTLSEQGFGEYYDMPLGAIIQRMATNTIHPISPAYKNLTTGGTVDPFIVRKPDVKERFFAQNFDYASLITIPDEYAMKQIFISDYGMSDFMGGIFTGLENGYTVQVYLNKLEAINAGLHSTKFPLQDSQKFTVAMGTTPTAAQLTDFILTVKNIVSAMSLSPQSNAFNAMKFTTTQNVADLKLLVRVGYKNAIAVEVMANAYNQERLNLPIDVIEVPHFGGLTPYKEAAHTTALYPVYDTFGAELGYAETAGATTVTVSNDAVFWKDPSEGIIAIIVDKGYVFETRQNPYRVEPIRNPRGLYTNYWASSPNNAINVDSLYNVAVISTTTPATT